MSIKIIKCQNINDKISVSKKLSKLNSQLLNYEILIFKSAFDKKKLIKIRKDAFKFGISTSQKKPDNTFGSVRKSVHRIDNNVKKMRVACINHMYQFAENDINFKTFHKVVKTMNDFRNRLLNINESEFSKNGIKKGYVSRPVIKHYPIGGGYMSAHTDKLIDKYSLQLIIPLSEKGENYQDGGLSIKDKNGTWIDVEKYLKLGDFILCRPDLEHRVREIDKYDKSLKWKSERGKWSLIGILDKF